VVDLVNNEGVPQNSDHRLPKEPLIVDPDHRSTNPGSPRKRRRQL
jgi:hypothetical protein